MSVEFTAGNLLDWPAGVNVIVSGSNSFGSSGAGLARQIAAKYPDAAREYRHWCESASGGRADLGTFLVTPVDDAARRIVWLITQRDVGTSQRQLDYEALYSGLEHLRTLLQDAHQEGRHYTLGLPMWIGCGLAGGSARVVEAMVRDLFEPSPIRCVVVEFAPTAQ